ncbi:MAG: serine protease [Chloroflexota bacterium]
MLTLRVFAQLRTIFVTITMFLSIAILLVSVVPAHAQQPDSDLEEPDDAKMHETVSSDGYIPPSIAAHEMMDFSPAFEGSGQPVNDGTEVVFDKPVAAVTAPGDSVGIDSVIGPDSRYRITNTTSSTYRKIVHITSNSGGCTGWLISADTVATAGHCVYYGGWSQNVRVYPGRDGSSTPYGSCSAERLFAPSGWTQSYSPSYDYGAIKLNCTIGNQTGWFGFQWENGSRNGESTNISGYPGDKPYGTMWRSDGSVQVTENLRLFYANDTIGGMSGSPVWNNELCNQCAVGIHAYGVGGSPYGLNGATRITQEVFNNLMSWKNS